MADDSKIDDNPLVPQEGSTPRFAASVIDLGGVRVEYGMPRFYNRRCDHHKLVYNSGERRVWCSDCERTIDGFDAFMTLAHNFHKMMDSARTHLQRAEAAEKAKIVLIGAKEIERTWRHKLAPCCPSCRAGLLPEDFARGASSCVSMELTRAVRAKQSKEGI